MQRNHTKEKFNNHLVDIISINLQPGVTKNNINQKNKRKMIDFEEHAKF